MLGPEQLQHDHRDLKGDEAESAAEKLYALVSSGAGEADLRAVLDDRDKKQGRFFFSEAEINTKGYRFLRDGKVDQAITMFKLNTTLYPDSWNVYDSLAEAVLKAGHTEKAIKLYEKSLTLNPENNNGRDVLAKLKTGTAAK